MMRRVPLHQSSLVGRAGGCFQASSSSLARDGVLSRAFGCTTSPNAAAAVSTLKTSLTRRSQVWIPTEKEVPSEAAIPSHQLLIRGGFIRKHGFGLYSFLPLGKKILSRLEQLIDIHMLRIGGNKLDLPLLIPNSLWKQSGRWKNKTPELMTLQDRRDEVFCLAPTHEESITSLVAAHFRPTQANASTHPNSTATENSSSRESLRVYQIGKKFRDEIRPRFGLLRAREFIMKDMYSFDTSHANCQITYHQVVDAYHTILKDKLGLPIAQVEADSGSIGGNLSHEFHVLSRVGEDTLLSCRNDQCGYAANIEKAHGKLQPQAVTSVSPANQQRDYPAAVYELVNALAQKLDALQKDPTQNDLPLQMWQQMFELSEQFGKLYHHGHQHATAEEHEQQLQLQQQQNPLGFACRTFLCSSATENDEATTSTKTSFTKSTKTVAIALVRGDRSVNGFSLKPFLPDQDEPRPIPFAEALKLLSEQKQMPVHRHVFVDNSLDKHATTDATVHLLHQVLTTLSSNATNGIDQVTNGNFREAQEGDLCGKCGMDNLEKHRGIEVGHVFYLGTKYSKPFGAVMGSANTAVPLEMGCYGMGVSRLVAAIVEANHDDKGIIWPVAVAPFKIVVMTIGKTLANDDECPLKQAAYQVTDKLARLCQKHAHHEAGAGTGGIGGADVLLDDRWKESAGSKLAESELLGFPYRVVLGKRFLKEQLVEVQTRATMHREFLTLEQLEQFFNERANAGEL